MQSLFTSRVYVYENHKDRKVLFLRFSIVCTYRTIVRLRFANEKNPHALLCLFGAYRRGYYAKENGLHLESVF